MASHVDSTSHSVSVSEILAVRELDVDGGTKDDGRWQKMPQKLTEAYPYAFTVSYVERVRQHRWRCSDVTFHCPEGALCQQPKHLLVYINPYGGKQQGKRIYEQKVAPLFACASISTDVIVTEHANHARDHLRTEAELKQYDGVVCVGGDGMFSEIVHGLVFRAQKDNGVDQNSPEEKLVPCTLRIGIIPAGSTDCICYATVGINDPVTSALHIIVGDSQPMDVCSVHHNNTFLRYSVSLLGYGFYGDVLADSVRKRWMGPARYDFSGRCFICQHDGQLYTEDSPEKCKTAPDVSDSEKEGGWGVIRGKFLAINAASMSCACPRSPKGLSPAAHLADGTTDLILVRKCSRFNFLRHLLRHTSKDDQFDMTFCPSPLQFDMTFVEVHRVRRFRFTPCQNDSELDLRENGKQLFSQICHPAYSSWNCDGEILPHAAIEVGVHCQLIKLFARGIEEQSLFEDLAHPCAL
ncbi:unnamed protein product [Coregonus sp. 'balchen']|nr:unnamed protein product [Coregonus sp. 'balchen']